MCSQRIQGPSTLVEEKSCRRGEVEGGGTYCLRENEGVGCLGEEGE